MLQLVPYPGELPLGDAGRHLSRWFALEQGLGMQGPSEGIGSAGSPSLFRTPARSINSAAEWESGQEGWLGWRNGQGPGHGERCPGGQMGNSPFSSEQPPNCLIDILQPCFPPPPHPTLCSRATPSSSKPGSFANFYSPCLSPHPLHWSLQ